jgi:hypothetical protein
LANASGLSIPEMGQMIKIMRFSLSMFVIGVSGTSSLDEAQTPEWEYSKKNHDSSPVKKFAKSLAWECWSISRR